MGFVRNLNRMLHDFRDDVLEEIMVCVGRLGNVGIVFAGAVGIVKFREDIFPCCPIIGGIGGIVEVFITLALLVSIAFGV